MSNTPREQAATKAAVLAAATTDEGLRQAWIFTELAPATSELVTIRDWLMDELERRMGADLFNQWLCDVDGAIRSTPDPGPYLAKRRA